MPSEELASEHKKAASISKKTLQADHENESSTESEDYVDENSEEVKTGDNLDDKKNCDKAYRSKVGFTRVEGEKVGDPAQGNKRQRKDIKPKLSETILWLETFIRIWV